MGDCCIKANRCVAFGIRLRSHTEVCELQTSPSAPCASSFLQSLDNLASKIVRLLTFATVFVGSHPCPLISNLCPLTSIYISLRGNSSDSLLSRISTWKISNLHVDIFYFPRGRDSFPPKFYLIPPKNFFFPTWKIKILHVGISKSPRGNQFSPTWLRFDMPLDVNYCIWRALNFTSQG